MDATQHIPVIRDDEPRTQQFHRSVFSAPGGFRRSGEERERADEAWAAWADRPDDDFGPGPDRLGAPDEPRTGGRSRKRLLVVGGVVVVVLVAAAGVLFASPTVAAKVGLASVVGVSTTADPPAPVAVSPQLRAADGPAPTAAGVSAALSPLATDPALGTFSGTVLDSSSGTVLWNHDADLPQTPASTNKVLTSAAALLSLDPLSTFDTTVVAGSTPGTVVLVGGGDPTLSSMPAGQDSVYPGAARLSDLAAQVKAKVKTPISRIVVDESRFSGPTMAQGWLPSDVQAGNWTPIVPAMLNGGRMDPTEVDGERVQDPAQTIGDALATDLGVSTSAVSMGTAPAGAQQLGVVHSANVQDLVANLLVISDNVLAEELGRAVARADGKPATFQGATDAIKDVLQRNGFDTTGLSNMDASGLSTQDHVPARLLAAVLRSATAPDGADPHTAKLRPLLVGLPIGGATGTLAGRFTSPPADVGKGWVRAKTGTLTGVNTLAGEVLDADGHVLVFALMSGNSPATNQTVEGALDTMAAKLRGCGCGAG